MRNDVLSDFGNVSLLDGPMNVATSWSSSDTDGDIPAGNTLMVERLCMLSHSMRQIAVQEVFGKHGLDMRDWQVLSAIRELGCATQRDVVKLSKLDKVAVNRAAARLKEKELIDSLPNRHDGRSHLLELSKYGESTIQQCTVAIVELERIALSDFTAGECNALANLLDRLGEFCTERQAMA